MYDYFLGGKDTTPPTRPDKTARPSSVRVSVTSRAFLRWGIQTLALRLPHAAGPHRPVDLLLATTGSRPLARHMLRPAADFQTVYTTPLPYAFGCRTHLLAALPARPGRKVRATLSTLAQAVADGPVVIDLAVAGGPTSPGSLSVAW